MLRHGMNHTQCWKLFHPVSRESCELFFPGAHWTHRMDATAQMHLGCNVVASPIDVHDIAIPRASRTNQGHGHLDTGCCTELDSGRCMFLKMCKIKSQTWTLGGVKPAQFCFSSSSTRFAVLVILCNCSWRNVDQKSKPFANSV